MAKIILIVILIAILIVIRIAMIRNITTIVRIDQGLNLLYLEIKISYQKE